MLKWIVPALLALAARAGGQAGAPPAAAKSDATADLKAACAKIAAGKSYSFDSSSENDAPAPGGGPRDNTPFAGKVEIGGVAELKRGDTVAYRKGEKLACKKKDSWELYSDAPAKGGGGGGGKGGRYGGGGGGSGTEAKEKVALKSLSVMVLPHDLLATFDANVRDVKASDSDGKHVFTATLTDSAALELSGAKEMNGAAPRGPDANGKLGTSGGSYKATGTATFVIGKDGNAERVVIETQIKNKVNDYKQKRTIALRDWGTAKFNAPKDAVAALGG
jgi:hypothetical protein